ncbi:hypothetical protein KBT16_13135, partial [Nostoc sp. CCCryo 231-06]|nr:hypothetical protein [Nostoc sp. CCCryo 231-06]
VNQFQNNSVNQSVSGEVINSNTNVTSPESKDVNLKVISCQQPEPANANESAVPTEVVTVTSPYTPSDTADSTDSYFIIPIIESNEMLQPISPSRSNIEQIVGTGLEKLLTQFCNHQSEILRVHDQYLKSQAECSQSFFQLMQQQYHVLLGSNNLKSQQIELAPEQIPTNNFVLQTPTPANTVANGTLIDAPQTNLVNNTLTLVPPAKVESSSPETKSVASLETVDRAELFMQVISSKTGYPVTMLNWEINPRADLGIDAVKWMDIISAIQESLPDVPKVNPKELAEQPTLRQVAEYIQIRVPQPSQSPQVAVSTSASSIETIAPQPVSTEDTFLTQSLLDVISDKTGYPAEMLETEMDLEADLGVDSIKRVEIIGAMQTLFPNLPKLSPEELGEQRTIGKIANYLGTKITEAKKKFLMPV